MEKLFAEFGATGAAEWKLRLEKDLKGITFDQLTVADRNGIPVHPFYTAADLAETSPAPVYTRPDWSICTRIIVQDAVTANKEALAALDSGVSGICFDIQSDIRPELLLQSIELPYIYSYFTLTRQTLAFATKLAAYLGQQYRGNKDLQVYLQLDVIRHYLAHNSWQDNKTTDLDHFLSLQSEATGLHTFCMDASLFQNAGAQPTYELACALAQLNEYLNLASGNKLAVKRIHITLATDTAFFEQIAKLRAFRLLTSLLLEQYGIKADLHLHVVTSNTYRSPFDSYSNLLRDTIAGMAAVAGGCNSLYIPGFDPKLESPTAFSLRMSRNQQLIFKEESYLDKVADVAAGSYYLETLTTTIAEQAWELFKTIEQQGGLMASFEQGLIQQQIHQQAAALVQEYKDGKRVLIGVNKFPNPTDLPHSLAIPPGDTNSITPLYLTEKLTHA